MDKKSKTWKKIDELVDKGDPNMSDASMLRFLGLDSNLLKDLESQSLDNARESVKVKINFINAASNPDPVHEHIDDSGMDLRADIKNTITILPGDIQIIDTGLKTEWIATQKVTASYLLTPYDWYIIRKLEETTAIPATVSKFRDDVRSACAEREKRIKAALDVTALKKLIDTTFDSDDDTKWPAQP